jgi:hypothetical protein
MPKQSVQLADYFERSLSVSPCFASGAFCWTANSSRSWDGFLMFDVTADCSVFGSSSFLRFARDGCSVMCDIIDGVGVLYFFF